MPQKRILYGFGMVVVLGSVWGVAEAGLGLALNACAKLASGSIMTGVALFFLAAARLRARSARGPLLAAGLAIGFKLFDAALLGLPLRHGAVANPMFAFVTEAGAAILLFAVLGRTAQSGLRGRILLGAAAAGLSAMAFPLVKLATGIPACVVPGTSVPLSIAFAPLAMAAGALAVPLAFAF
ncbi:MAG: hypothetical protein ABSA30_12650, partial [Candidatus Aminicenantales bacterium]